MRQGQHGSQGMRQGQQNKRMRGRGRKMPNQLNRVYESNGPDVKVRGNAAHIAEKYVSLARDAQSSGDWVSAENYLQHAEHYFRIVAAAQAQTQPQQGHDGDDDDDAAPVSRDMTESDQEAADALAQPELQPQPQARSRRRRANGHETRSGADDAQPAADEARASGTPDGQAALAQVNGTAASAEAAGGTQPDAAADQPAEQSAEQPV